MATNTPNLNLAKQNLGENPNTWGDVLNNNFDKIDALGARPYIPYIVEPTDSIQDAIDEAFANGAGVGNPAIVYPRPGTYTENLTLYPYIHIAGPDDSRYPVSVVGSHNYITASGTVASNQITISNMSFSADTGQSVPIFDITGAVANKIFLKNLSIQGQSSQNTSIIKANVEENSEVNIVDSHVYGPNGGAGVQPIDAIIYIEGAMLNITNTNVDSYGARAVYYDPQATWGGWLKDAALDLRAAPTFTGGFLKINGSDTGWGRLVDVYRGRVGSAPYSHNLTQPAIELTGMLSFGLWSPVLRTDHSSAVLFTNSGNTVDMYYTWIAYGESHAGGSIPPASANFTPHPLKIDDSKQVTYDATSPADWTSPAPTDIQSAIDRVAAEVAILKGSPIA